MTGFTSTRRSTQATPWASALRLGIAALVAGLCVINGALGTAQAQQPTTVNAQARSVNEDQLLKALKPEFGSTAAIEGRGSIPDKKSYRLEQPAGRDWDTFRHTTLTSVAAIAILGMLALLCVFYLVRGKIPMTGGRAGKTLVRFGSVERFAHWLSATSFVILGLSGLNITFGRQLVLPLVGAETFATVTQLGKFAHNYVSFAFALGIVLMFVMWAKDNLPSVRDIAWFAQGGGLIGRGHPPADRFNGGQKVIFWSVVLGGSIVSLSGYMLMFPFVVTDIGGQQAANVVHALGGVIMIAIILAHIYIGSLGMEGAFEAMGSGKVDLNWAREHHSIWAEKAAARDGLSRDGQKPTPAE